MSKTIQKYRQFDIVQHTWGSNTATGMIVVVSGNQASVSWFGEARRKTAWWEKDELTIIGNAMSVIMDQMNGLCDGVNPDEQFPIQMVGL